MSYLEYKQCMSFGTHVMDEFSLQEAHRFQGEQVVDEEGVWVFESTDDTAAENEWTERGRERERLILVCLLF